MSCTLTYPLPWLAACELYSEELYSRKYASLIGCIWVVLSQIRLHDWLQIQLAVLLQIRYRDWLHVSCTTTNPLPCLTAWELYSHIRFHDLLHGSCTLTNPLPWLATCELDSHTSASVIGCMGVVHSQIRLLDWLHRSCTLTKPLPWLAACQLYSHKSTSVCGCMWVVLSQIFFRVRLHVSWTLTNPNPWKAACELYSHTSTSLIGCVGGAWFDWLVGSLNTSVSDTMRWKGLVFNSARRFQLIRRRLHTVKKLAPFMYTVLIDSTHRHRKPVLVFWTVR